MRLITLVFLFTCLSIARADDAQLPIIDMHLHAYSLQDFGPPPQSQCVPWPAMPVWDQRKPYADSFPPTLSVPPCDDPVWAPQSDSVVRSQTIAAMKKLNIYGVLSGHPDRVAEFVDSAPDRFWPGFEFRLDAPGISPEKVRGLHESKRLAVLAEIVNQYAGIEPDDPKMEPYWSLLEQLDIPAGIHIGTGPPGAVYLGNPNYRGRMHSALTLEEVLVRHPGLRIYIMHAGYPMLDDLLAVLYAHPQVYVGVGVIVWLLPREEFYRYLEGIVQAGFGDRVMFGSDQMIWPGVIERAVAVIESAPFLDRDQKRAILYGNAARFLRLPETEIARHHGR